jgi:hypothetical protein
MVDVHQLVRPVPVLQSVAIKLLGVCQCEILYQVARPTPMAVDRPLLDWEVSLLTAQVTRRLDILLDPRGQLRRIRAHGEVQESGSLFYILFICRERCSVRLISLYTVSLLSCVGYLDRVIDFSLNFP